MHSNRPWQAPPPASKKRWPLPGPQAAAGGAADARLVQPQGDAQQQPAQRQVAALPPGGAGKPFGKTPGAQAGGKPFGKPPGKTPEAAKPPKEGEPVRTRAEGGRKRRKKAA